MIMSDDIEALRKALEAPHTEITEVVVEWADVDWVPVFVPFRNGGVIGSIEE